MDAIPSKLLDKELGVKPTAEVEEIPSDAKPGNQAQSEDQAEKGSGPPDAQRPGHAQQAKQAGVDGDPEGEEEGRERLPLFSHKVMTFVQHLLNYKVGPHSNASSTVTVTADLSLMCLFGTDTYADLMQYSYHVFLSGVHFLRNLSLSSS